METALRSVLLLATFLAPAASMGAQANWEFDGELTSITGTDVPPDFKTGTPFRIAIRWDTSAPLTQTIDGSVSGKRYVFNDQSMRMAVYLGETCNPCEVMSPGGGFIRLRDNFSDGAPPVDGYTFDIVDDDTSLGVIMRGPVLDIVDGPNLSATPDSRLASLATAVFQVCAPFPGTPGQDDACKRLEFNGQLRYVGIPTFGTGFLFTARDCRVAVKNANDPTPYNCVNLPGAPLSNNRVTRWSIPSFGEIGGGVGYRGFEQQYSPTSGEIDANYGDGQALQASLGLPDAPLGSMYGFISFGGPASMPVVKGSSFPSDISRTNSNLFAYQKYSYTGGATELPLVLNLTYTILENSNDSSVDPNSFSERPGGAQFSAVLSIVDGSVPIELIDNAGRIGFNAVVCGNEASLGLPPGSILGAANHRSQEGESGSRAAVVQIDSCSSPGEQVKLAAGQDFYVATSMQTPARGKAPQPPSSNFSVQQNGFVDSANTLRISLDPAASPAVVQQFVSSIEPACGENCGEQEVPDVVDVKMDLKPGDAGNCVNVGSKGVIPVALLGSLSLNVSQVRADNSLKLGSQSVRIRNGRAQCSTENVNGDEYLDLVCHFENSPSNWTQGQLKAIVTGALVSGVAIEASDDVCLKP